MWDRWRETEWGGEAIPVAFGVGICPRALEQQTIMVSICNVACSCVRTLWVRIYYILLPAIGAVNGVFAYYPHSGGQA